MFEHVILITLIQFVAADFKIDSVIMKPLRIGDIGLNFDMSISNLNSKSTFLFTVSCEKCCVYLQGNETECSSKIVGGTFGDIHPGKSGVVTLVWPNIVIFNRIGYCDIEVTATKSVKDKIRLAWRIEFNTTFDAHSKKKKIFDYIPKTANLTKCSSPDLNPFDRCSPINCEAKYMGKRNFYNPISKLCELVPECSHQQDEIYDYTQNECIVLSKILTESDLEKLKTDEFDNYDWEPSSVNSPFTNPTFGYPNELLEEQASRKNKSPFTRYAIYFSILNCGIVLIICCTFYCILAICVSSALGRSNQKHLKKTENL